jgi:DNA-binding response OmpR family regulator
MPRILIVDDEPELLTILGMLYEIEGFTVYLAEDGQHALDVISKNAVDIVLTDLMMPRLDGLRLSQKLRQSSEYGSIPIVMHTAASGAVPGLGLHYDALIAKPSTFENQLSVIQALLSRPSGEDNGKRTEGESP